MNAVYKFTENGITQYAYSHYGANHATGMIRYMEACRIAEKTNLPVTGIIMDITYDGSFLPTENNGNKVFNKIDNYELNDTIIRSFAECGLIESRITIDLDKDLYKYKTSSKHSSEDIILPLSEAAKLAQTKAEQWNRNYSSWNMNDLSDSLKSEFKALQKEFNYAMDIVVVQPGLPAEHIVLDVSQNKLRAMQNIVDGLIEPIYSLSEPGIIVYGNEEARIMEMEPNRRVPGEQPVCGTFFICGDKNGDCCSLTEEQINKYLKKFRIPDRFSEAERTAAHECSIVFQPSSNDKEFSGIILPAKRGRS